ncbi:MAG: ADP-ribosylation factor-like protein [Candidatus Hodarchaeales archaeon]
MSYLAKKDINKILILGLQASGKTTIINAVTEGYIPTEKDKYLPTIDYDRKKVILAGQEIVIFDMGGQTSFLDRFTDGLSDFIFTGVKALIFVVDSMKPKEITQAKYYLDISLAKLAQYSPTAFAYLFQHKTDLVPEHLKDEVRKTINDHLLVNIPLHLRYFETSVFTSSIFNAIGDVFAKTYGVSETLKPLLETFIQHNDAEMAQIFTKAGVPLIQIDDFTTFEHISLAEVRKVFDAVVQNLANSADQISSSVFFESNNSVFIVKFNESGLVLFLGFQKEKLQEKRELLPSLFSKVIAFSGQLENTLRTI